MEINLVASEPSPNLWTFSFDPRKSWRYRMPTFNLSVGFKQSCRTLLPISEEQCGYLHLWRTLVEVVSFSSLLLPSLLLWRASLTMNETRGTKQPTYISAAGPEKIMKYLLPANINRVQLPGSMWPARACGVWCYGLAHPSDCIYRHPHCSTPIGC